MLCVQGCGVDTNFIVEKNKTTFINMSCGAKGSKDSGPFHIKPKTHAEEEELPEDE